MTKTAVRSAESDMKGLECVERGTNAMADNGSNAFPVTRLPLPSPLLLWRRGLEFAHSGAANPEGCQTVAGGCRGFLGTATSGQWRRIGPAPRLGCQTHCCRACSILALPQSQLIAVRIAGQM